MLPNADSAWLEYQVRMGKRLDLEKFTKAERDIFKALFQDGFEMGRQYERLGS